MISHDRTFLDNVTKRTVEISKAKLYDYKFSYSKYLIQREQEIEKQEAAAKNQQKYIEDTQKLIDKFRAKKDKAAFAQTLIRKLDKLEKIEVDDFDSTKAHAILVFDGATQWNGDNFHVVVRVFSKTHSWGYNIVV